MLDWIDILREKGKGLLPMSRHHPVDKGGHVMRTIPNWLTTGWSESIAGNKV
jgi:hypothetical protein